MDEYILGPPTRGGRLDDGSRPGCISTLLSLVLLGGLLYGLFYAYNYVKRMGEEKTPAAVQAEIQRYLADPGRERSTRDSGQVPSLPSGRRGAAFSKSSMTDVEANLSTLKAMELVRNANQTGVRMFNFIESANSGEVWIWYANQQNARKFLEQAQLVGAILSYEPGYQTSESREGKYTIYISKILVRW